MNPFATERTAAVQDGRRIYGCVVGIVTDNAHPGHDYRVRLRFPWLGGDDQSGWARIAATMASRNGTGAYFLPEIDDEVLVVFEGGDVDRPIVIGCLWNGVDKPAYCNRDGRSETKRFSDNDRAITGNCAAKKNDLRGITTRAGHSLLFNDNRDAPRTVLASGKRHRIVLDDSENQPTQIEIVDGNDENFLRIDTKNKTITLETTTGDLILKAKKRVRIECEEFQVVTERDASIEAKGSVSVKASMNASVKADGSGSVEASGMMAIKGAIINLN